jgi:heptosyltransferase-1
VRVLIVKTSSLGDVLHTLPAVTDACSRLKSVKFHWVVEESLAEIPAWHPGVEHVIPVAMRRWRKALTCSIRAGEFGDFRRRLQTATYDHVIDAQGLMKSAVVTRLARGLRSGLDRASAREPLLGFAYHRRFAVAKGRHAIERVRRLFSLALDYPLPATPPDYGLTSSVFGRPGSGDYLVFAHGTTWTTKLWPEAYWINLARRANAAGLGVCLPWGDAEERARAERIAAVCRRARVVPRGGLTELAGLLVRAHGVVAVDTGLSHLAAALGVPVVGLYGATDPGLTGARGPLSAELRADFACSPCLSRRCRHIGNAPVAPACYATLPPARVWAEVERIVLSQREAVNQ